MAKNREKKPYRRLSVKLLCVIFLASLASIALALVIHWLGFYLVETVYCTPERQARRMQCAITSFRDYVAEQQVVSTDVERIGVWNLDQPYVRLAVSTQSGLLNSDRWGAELIMADNGLVLRADNSGDDVAVFAVNFRDGAFQVQLQEFSQDKLYVVINWGAVVAACLLFLALVLLYSSRVTSTVRRLAQQVRQVSTGDLGLEIIPTSNDEIGDLAGDVDAMRLSIIDKLQREEAAWRANTQLITAISHDVRTPLTTLMGYLDMLREDGELPAQQRQEYLELCYRKAEKLRTLTNELFSYFLVFGKPEPDLELEVYNAQPLLDQLLGEPGAELTVHGYDVRVTPLAQPGSIRVDVQHLRRVFDNLFSNVRKYADASRPVVMDSAWVAGELRVRITNSIPARAGRVESTKIGLQTCEKLLTSMGGRFLRAQTETAFTAEVVLPRWEAAEVPGV